MLKELDVSRLGFYDYLKRVPSKTKLRKERIIKEIKKIHKESYEIYGSPKITELLNKKGEKVSQKYVYSIMKENNIKAKYIKPYIQTTVSHDFSDKLKNLLNRHYDPTKPNVAWCTDITYIWTYDDGFVYLTSIMDLYSRKIISWVLSDTLETKWVVEAVNKAKRVRNADKPLIMHSDRGRQYTAKDYEEATAGMTLSYSKKAYPWDNACIESFHSLLKREWINRFKIIDYNHAYKLVFEYIEAFYNTVRIHSHCDYASPNDYEKKYWIKLRQMEINVA